MTRLLNLGIWVPILDGDPLAAEIYQQHYASERSRARREARGTLLTLGPGQKLLLATPSRRAHFAWRIFIDDSKQEGVNCAWFANHGVAKSSVLIRAADVMADQKWPGMRHYTYVDPDKVGGNPPGNSFLHAGWRYALDENGERLTTKKRKLFILERPAPDQKRAAA